MQIKPSKIAFICFLLFLRIEAFQWVIGKKIKEIRLASQVVCKTSQALSFLGAGGLARWVDPASALVITQDHTAGFFSTQ
jgi:hypothetical protein